MSPRATIAAGLVSVALAGCGLRDPYTTTTGARTQPRSAASGAPTPPAPSQQAEGASSEQSLLARFATAWINWTAASLPAQRTTLAALATGELAGRLRQDAAQALRSRLQEVTGAYSRGRYVGVIPQPNGQLVLVTYEQAAPEGGAQPQGAYHVYLARAQHTSSGWRLSGWQPAIDG
jgi:hypothetical protein